jgi:hypothetical protein
LNQELSGFDCLTFFKIYFGDFAGDAASYRDRGERRHGADLIYINIQIPACDQACRHRYRGRLHSRCRRAKQVPPVGYDTEDSKDRKP